MLTELKVSNFAIIDKISVPFKTGLNVLSGETGSGKSVLLKSLALLMGEKSVSDTIKTGAEQARVEGLFDISHRPDIKKRLLETGVTDDTDDTLVVKRIISVDGKNRVYINGSLSTLQQLRDIVSPLIELTGHPAPLIEMTGQHESRHLQSRAYHLEALDQYTGALALRKKVEDAFHERSAKRRALEELEESARTKSQRLDFLTYQRDEILALDLKPGEEDSLESELKLLKDSSKLNEFIESAESALYSDDDSALVRVHRIIQKGLEFSGLAPRLNANVESLQQAKTLLEEVVYDLREYGQNVNTNSNHLNEIEEKLSSLRKLQKKYGSSVTEILAALQTIQSEIQELENSEVNMERLRDEVRRLDAHLEKQARQLHKMRLGGADTLAKSVNAELNELNMKGVLFSIRVNQLPLNEINASGCSEVEFMIQSSKKDTPRALAKFASGGELSRILLSLKRVVGVSEHPRTYLFDEVDAGVSGVTAEKVGRKLKSIAKGQQVICITHLPQVAAFADAHYVISKSQSHGETRMTVKELGAQEQVHEIARMLSGEKITKTSLEHARELLSL